MNLTRSAFLLVFISILSVLRNIKAADTNSTPDQTQNQNYPLYVTRNNIGYDLADPLNYDEVINKRKFHDPNDKNKILLAACPKSSTNDGVLEIVPKTEEQLASGFWCDKPVKYAIKNDADVTEYKIGYPIKIEYSDRNTDAFVIPNLFQYYIPLISVERKTAPNIAVPRVIVRHNITYGKMLPEIENTDQQSQTHPEYEKNIDIYGYDIDKAYKENYQLEFNKKFFRNKPESNYRLEKLQLAPADDFFFDLWKGASRTNINTTPVWGELVSEWRKLEKFVRRVARFIDNLQIVTGGSNIDTTTPGTEQISYLYKSEDPSEEPLPVFELIFKTISFNQKRQDDTWLRQGILFGMRNNPLDRVTAVDDLLDESGWKYYSNDTSDRRLVAELMNPRTVRWEHIDDKNVYEPLNLNKVKVLSQKDGKEIEIEVNVLEKILKNWNTE